MARQSWFDADTNELMFTQYMEKMDSWQQAMADGRIDEAELEAQAQRVQDLLKALEPKLDDALHAQVTEVLYELAVLQGMAQVAIASDQG